MNERINRANRFKKVYKTESVKFSHWLKKLENLKYQDVVCGDGELNGNTLNYTLTIPEPLVSSYNSIKEKLYGADEDGHFREPAEALLWGHEDLKCDELEWRLQIQGGQNRIHISGAGLPFTFRGKGLGKKLYKRLILKIGYITSVEPGSYKYSDLLWSSLVDDSELYCFGCSKKLLAILKGNVPDDIVEILRDNFSTADSIVHSADADFWERFESDISSNDNLKHKLKR